MVITKNGSVIHPCIKEVGQCGNQIGGMLWSSILQEYNIDVSTDTVNKNQNNDLQESFTSFFHVEDTKRRRKDYTCLKELLDNKVKARVVCIDMEDSVVGRFKTGPLNNLFDKKCYVTNYPGSGNNWAEGYCEHGPNYKNKILKAIQHAVERCDRLHGFILLFSTGGGTGSGLGTYVLKMLTDIYPTIERFVACVYPIGTEDVITAPYNMAFATQELIKNATCVFPVENRSLLDILSKQSERNINKTTGNYSICKSFDSMNNFVVDMLLDLTSGSRFPGSLNFDINDLNTNMVPFPKMHFLCSGLSTFTESKIKISRHSKQIRDEIFLSTCSTRNQLLQVDPLGPKSVLIASTLIGRGDYSLTDMREYVDKIQNKSRFTPWSRKAVKIGLCEAPRYKANIAMLSLFNTSSMANFFNHILNQHIKLYNKKAHIHHYLKIPGFEEDYFFECQEALQEISTMYQEMESVKPANIPRIFICKN